VNEKLNNIESKLGKIEEIEKNAGEISEELKRQKEKIECHSNELERHSNELEHLNEKLKTEDHDKQKDNYSEFAVKKGIYLFTLKHEIFIKYFFIWQASLPVRWRTVIG
jgi:DNA repair exonuclease SbcCD ATPase subunit